MNDTKGFTLIELLAVIVILAVIALIATPLIMNVIDEARMGAAEDSMNHYIDAVELSLVRAEVTSQENGNSSIDGLYETKDGNLYMDGNKKFDVEVKGTAPADGSEIYIKDKKIVNAHFTFSGYQMNYTKPGENLLLGTKTMEHNDEVFVIDGEMIDETMDGNKVLKTSGAWRGYKFRFNKVAPRVGIKVGDTLTYSIYVKTDAIPTKDVSLDFYVWNDSNNSLTYSGTRIKTISMEDSMQWQQISFTFVVTEDLLEATAMRIESDYYENEDYTTSQANVLFSSPKLEFGSKATP